MYKIIACIGSAREEIAQFDDFDEARRMAIEYQTAYGDEFKILVQAPFDGDEKYAPAVGYSH
tara:strand:- start:1139 stop:1324 length:186 start_codon:yes stop_codon:yes gene_type:complete